MTLMTQCAFCKRYRSNRGPTVLCDAFPEGVPFAILNNEVDHRHAYPGDHNIRWEQSADTLETHGAIDLFSETGRPEPALAKAS